MFSLVRVIRLGLVRLGLARLGLVKLGLVRLGLVRFGLVRLGHVGQVKIICKKLYMLVVTTICMT